MLKLNGLKKIFPIKLNKFAVAILASILLFILLVVLFYLAFVLTIRRQTSIEDDTLNLRQRFVNLSNDLNSHLKPNSTFEFMVNLYRVNTILNETDQKLLNLEAELRTLDEKLKKTSEKFTKIPKRLKL